MFLIQQKNGSAVYFNCEANLEEIIEGDNSVILNELADGTYSNCIVQVTDEAGNTGDNLTISEFEIDTIAPVVSVNELITNDNTPLITGSVDDINAEVSINLNEADYSASVNDSGNWEFQIEDSLDDGVYEVKATAIDLAGNVGTDSTNNELSIDTQAPELSFVDSVEEGPVLSDTIVINYSDTTELTKKYAFVKDIEYCNGELEMSDYEGEFTISDEGNNSYYVCVYGEDALGNSNFTTSENVFNIDRTAPELSFVDSVEEGPVLIDLINISFGDAAVKKYEFAGGDSNCEEVAVNDYSEAFNIENEFFNSYYLYVYGEDALGNGGCIVSNESVQVDVSGPLINVLSSPENNEVIEWENREIEINFSSEDAYSEIDSCELNVNGENFVLSQPLLVTRDVEISPEDTYSNNSIYEAGTYNWEVVCNDSLGNENSTSGKFTVLSNFTEENGYNYTDLTNVENISNVTYFYVNNTYGMINWTQGIDFSSGFDWSKFINIFYGENKWGENVTTFYVNSSFDELNKEARLVFYNVTFTKPEIMKGNASYCSGAGATCPVFNYNETTHTLEVIVQGFTEYTVREYVAPPAVVNTGSGSGGGSGGGSTTTYWTCGEWEEWSTCLNGEQVRACKTKTTGDINSDDSMVQVRACEVETEETNSTNAEESEDVQNVGAGITGAITGAVVGFTKSGVGIAVLSFIVLLAGAGIGVRYYRKRKGFSKRK